MSDNVHALTPSRGVPHRRTVPEDIIRADDCWNAFVAALKQGFIDCAIQRYKVAEEDACRMKIEVCRGGSGQPPFIKITIPAPSGEEKRFLSSLQFQFPSDEGAITGHRYKCENDTDEEFTLSGTVDTSFPCLFETLKSEYFAVRGITLPPYPAVLKAQERWLQNQAVTACEMPQGR